MSGSFSLRYPILIAGLLSVALVSSFAPVQVQTSYAAQVSGGGMTSRGSMNLTAVTFVSNTAGTDAGGLENRGTLTMKNGIVVATRRIWIAADSTATAPLRLWIRCSSGTLQATEGASLLVDR